MNEDKLAVKLNNLENVTLHAIKTKDFSSSDFKEIEIDNCSFHLLCYNYDSPTPRESNSTLKFKNWEIVEL